MIFAKMEYLRVPTPTLADPDSTRSTLEFTQMVDMRYEVDKLRELGCDIVVIGPEDLSVILSTILEGLEVRFESCDDPEMISGWECHSLFICKTTNDVSKFRNIVRACLNRMRSPGDNPRNFYIGVA